MRPQTTNRDRVYGLLRGGGERGVTLAEFQEHGVGCPRPHIESLIFEGHVIEDLSGYEHDGGMRRLVRRWYLRRDRWAEDEAVAAVGLTIPEFAGGRT